jgi:sarcosine oxidase subunit beta
LHNGTVVIGGDRRAAIDRDSKRSEAPLLAMAPAVRAAIDLFPAWAGATAVRVWSSIEGFTADHLPVIGPGRDPPRSMPSVFQVTASR